jgi:RNA polymerase sigma-70 factor (ECF subfamily)
VTCRAENPAGRQPSGAVWASGGQPRVAFAFTITGGKVVTIDMIADPEHLPGLEVVML